MRRRAPAGSERHSRGIRGDRHNHRSRLHRGSRRRTRHGCAGRPQSHRVLRGDTLPVDHDPRGNRPPHRVLREPGRHGGEQRRGGRGLRGGGGGTGPSRGRIGHRRDGLGLRQRGQPRHPDRHLCAGRRVLRRARAAVPAGALHPGGHDGSRHAVGRPARGAAERGRASPSSRCATPSRSGQRSVSCWPRPAGRCPSPSANPYR